MLPFLKKDKSPGIAGLIVKTRQPDENPDSQDEGDPALESCASALISAIQSQDVKGVADAIKDAFEILESQPHDEAEPTSPHTYDDQKD